jgi:hypothetical protein
MGITTPQEIDRKFRELGALLDNQANFLDSLLSRIMQLEKTVALEVGELRTLIANHLGDGESPIRETATPKRQSKKR